MSDFSGILDVCIGLVFVYLLLALICSSVVELVEGWLKQRGSHLWDGIGELLQDDSGVARWKLYHHPLISGLYQGQLKAAADAGPAVEPENRQILPSYIASRSFALALIGMLTKDETLDSPTAQAATPADEQMQKLRNALQKRVQGSDDLSPAAAEALLLLIDSGPQELTHAMDVIGGWFDEMTHRVSGWYKRHAQKVALIVGFFIAFAGNFDTFVITKRLLTDPSVREVVVASATHFAETSGEPSGKAPDVSGQPVKQADADGAQDRFTSETLCGNLKADPACQRFTRQINTLDKLGLPVGWNVGELQVLSLTDWITKLFGLTITGLAVSLGAPFWFDLLNKFMKLRSALRPEPDKARNQ